MRPDQPHNLAIAEFEHNGAIARLTGTAATENDDAIRFIVELMAQEGISGHRILRLYSERKPDPKWIEYFAQHWPNAAVTWSFAPGEDAKMEAAVNELLANPRKPRAPRLGIPHWLMWFLTLTLTALIAYNHDWTTLPTLPLIAVSLLGVAVGGFQLLLRLTRWRLARMTPEQRDKFLARFSEAERRRLMALGKGTSFLLALLLLNGCVSTAPTSSDKSAAADAALSGDYLKLQGRWVVQRNEIKKITTPELHGRVFIFQGRTFRLDTDRGSERFVIDESTNPRSIDFDDGRLPIILGIYALDGDRLVLCTGDPGEPRPREFATSVFTGAVLTELSKEK